MMINIDPKGPIFLSHIHANNKLFLLLTIEFLLFVNKLLDIPEYAEMQYYMMASL